MKTERELRADLIAVRMQLQMVPFLGAKWQELDKLETLLINEIAMLRIAR